MLAARSFWNQLHRVHEDESGMVTLETILVLGAVALPILVFILKFGWPSVSEFFVSGRNELEAESRRITTGN